MFLEEEADKGDECEGEMHCKMKSKACSELYDYLHSDNCASDVRSSTVAKSIQFEDECKCSASECFDSSEGNCYGKQCYDSTVEAVITIKHEFAKKSSYKLRLTKRCDGVYSLVKAF